MATIADDPIELERLLRQPAVETATRSSLFVRVVEGLFGTVALIVLLATTAGIPLAQFAALGYLLVSSDRVAKTGKLTAGLVGLKQAAQLGRLGVVIGVAWLILRLISDFRADAILIDPTSQIAQRLSIVQGILFVLFALHIYGACLRGGRFIDFLLPPRPIKLWRLTTGPGAWVRQQQVVAEFVQSLQLPRLWWLGIRATVGTVIWLAVPVTILLIGREHPVLIAIGGLLLAPVICWIPYLQLQFVESNTWRALFQLRTVRGAYRRAPIAMTLALTLLLLFSVPLYLIKIELLPRETVWLPGLFFFVFIWPARIMLGWAWGRAMRYHDYRNWFVRFLLGTWGWVLVLAYVVVIFLTQYIAWNGAGELYIQHALLVPLTLIQ
jgi:hypothetical protein